jgi:hypothetical protein
LTALQTLLLAEAMRERKRADRRADRTKDGKAASVAWHRDYRQPKMPRSFLEKLARKGKENAI